MMSESCNLFIRNYKDIWCLRVAFYIIRNYKDIWCLRVAFYIIGNYKDIWCLKIVFFASKLKAFKVKPVLSSHSKKTQKMVFKTDYCLMQVKSIAKCSKGSILQYF